MSRNDSSVRTEVDSLGSVDVPKNALYGSNTIRGRDNFAIGHRVLGDESAFVIALAQVKKAAALANRDLGAIPLEIADAIVTACDELIGGAHHEWLVISMLEGSGGTSMNMNVNEVIANRALQIAGHCAGQYTYIHPNDHVNCGQSTNDVIPTALKLASHSKASLMLTALDNLGDALAERADAFSEVLRLGRTCMQDAQPMMLGQAFGGYASAVRRCRAKLKVATDDLLVVPLGGTAIGTGLGSVPGYRDAALDHLAVIFGAPVTGSDDLFDGMQNSDAFARFSAEMRTCADLMGKIAGDLIILSSGPVGGLGEISLPSVQPGSSIMPGKVNPVIPMMLQQIAFAVTGNDIAVSMAVMGGQLEINHFEPIVASRLFDSIEMVGNGARVFCEKCIKGIQALAERSLSNLVSSSALATVFMPKLGYVETSKLVKLSLAENRPFLSLVIERGHLTENEIDTILRQSTCVQRAKRWDPSTS